MRKSAILYTCGVAVTAIAIWLSYTPIDAICFVGMALIVAAFFAGLTE